MVVGEKKAQYDLFIFRFDSDHDTYDTRIKNNITYSGLNFVTLETGLCIYMNDEEELELFSTVMESKDIKVIDDQSVNGNMSLCKNGTQVLFTKNNILYSIKTKK